MMKVNPCHANIDWASIYKEMPPSSTKSELTKLIMNLSLSVKKTAF